MKTTIACLMALTALLTGAHQTGRRPETPAMRVPVADVYLYHPNIRSDPRKPPETTIIRFRVEAYVDHHPKAWHMTVHLMKWHSAKQRHRSTGAWLEVVPSETYNISQLPSTGTHDYLVPPAIWTCEPGAYYLRVHVFGIPHNGGTVQKVNLYFPWAGFKHGHSDAGNVHKPPSLKGSWHTECSGGDALIG